MTDTMIAQTDLKVKRHEMSQHEKWLRDPQRAASEDAARTRVRYERVGGQENYVLFTNAVCFLEAAEYFLEGGNLRLARYYLDLVRERVAMLEARCKHD